MPAEIRYCVECQVACHVTTSSGLCKQCFTKRVMNTPTPTRNPLEHICKSCGSSFKIVQSKDVCHPCYTAAEKKEQLKLYEVSVWEQSNGVRPASSTVVLDVDEEQAVDNVLEKMGYKNPVKTEVTELVGPYSSGFIVSFRTLP